MNFLEKFNNFIILFILALPRVLKRSLVLLTDICLCVFSVWLAYYLRVDEFLILSFNNASTYDFITPSLLAVVIAIPIFIVEGLYKAIFRYSSENTLLVIAKATIEYGMIYFTIFTIFGFSDVPRTLGIIQPIILFILIASSRMTAFFWLGKGYRKEVISNTTSRVLIYGAGHAGRQLFRALSNSNEILVCGYLDDDKSLRGGVLNNVEIYSPDELDWLIDKHQINRILLAIPSLSRFRRNQIISRIQKSHVSVQTLPEVSDIAEGKIKLSDIRDLDVEDLLGRDVVEPSYNLIRKNIHNKVVMVTGAGGSIGSELCRQIIRHYPKILILVDHSEFHLYKIDHELRTKDDTLQLKLFPILTSILDEKRIEQIMYFWRPSTVFHAAAYKHVPLVEHNPIQGLSNNVFSTLVLAKVALKAKVENFVLISSDKAVRPTNIMGVSKRISELILQAMSENSSHTKYSMVRFGNVLDSSGSVVPMFRQQIYNGGPITLTDAEVTRYFMTIHEAAQLVIQASSMAKGGDVFILDMGVPIKIKDLAVRMIELSGLTIKDENNSDGDIEIKVIGLRPGEKLYEELILGENLEPTAHKKIYRANEKYLDEKVLFQNIEELTLALNDTNYKGIKLVLKKIVGEFESDSDLKDYVR